MGAVCKERDAPRGQPFATPKYEPPYSYFAADLVALGDQWSTHLCGVFSLVWLGESDGLLTAPLVPCKKQGTAIPKAAINNASHEKYTFWTKWMLTQALGFSMSIEAQFLSVYKQFYHDLGYDQTEKESWQH